MKMTQLLSVAALLAIPPAAPAAAQDAPPGTEIHLAEIRRDAEVVQLGKPTNVTNRPGYDNQPAFSPGGEMLLYTSIDEKGQADIWVYGLGGKKRRKLRETPESEYSPTPVPGEDAISVVRVEADSRQRLWRFPMDGGEPSLLLPDVSPVGYHAWSDAENLVLFVLGEPPTLQKAVPGKGPGKILARNVGRALKRVPGSEEVAFVQKVSDGDWKIRRVDVATGKVETILATLPEREDFTFSPSGELWMADGSVLYVAKPGEKAWTLVADLADHGLKDLTRLAVHPDGNLLALVAAE